MKRFWHWFWRPTTRFAWGAIFIIGIITGVFGMGGFTVYVDYTNTLEFCVSCHDMEETVYPEYQQSGHYLNHEGVRVVCSDCHVPKAWGPKLLRKITSVNELYHKMIGTIDDREKFESRRLALAQRVWDNMKASDSRECRNCHSFEAMAYEKQSEAAQVMHPMAVENGLTCIDCHKGLAHRLPEED